MTHSELVIEVEALLNRAESSITDDCCIYKVPNYIREVNIEAYTPKLISIGPLHHFDQRLQNMEEYKKLYFKKFVAQSKRRLEDLIRAVEEDEQKLRYSYSENFNMSENDLVKLILVDTCFIVELFCNYFFEEFTHDTVMKLSSHTVMTLDLLLVENQLPFFILKKLYDLAFASHNDRGLHSFLEISLHFFQFKRIPRSEEDLTICHFTDLLRKNYLKNPSPGRNLTNVPTGFEPIPTATAFNEVGGKFRRNESAEGPLDLQFSGGCLEIPLIEWDNRTEALFRNMVALEQCHYPYNEGYICDYILVMDHLINTKEDEDLLVKNGILQPWLGENDAVAKMLQ